MAYNDDELREICILLFKFATHFTVEQARKSKQIAHHPLAGQKYTLETEDYDESQLNQAYKAMAFGWHDDESYLGFVNLVFGMDSMLTDEEFIDASDSRKCEWVFDPSEIRQRMRRILTGDTLKDIVANGEIE